ncbi:PREDICTED: carbonyl reductase [NADPH] 3 [Papilio xuthus]|uniref:carbonyl reductase (NADPH) n=1 Tax=Papilio xuthus TaxID=66420 RepID=A0AAJ7E6W1_PAPXU|nr:PREDICTED: carbonyl reductase [NADPH] 3 [Papilio xuthus]
MASKIAVVTGANKGLGFSIVKGLCLKFDGVIYLTARDEKRGREAVDKLKALGLHPEFHLLDVSDENSIKDFADYIKTKHGGLDVLVNNAGILESNVYPTYDAAKRNIDINYRSLLSIEKWLYPLLRDGARVVNVSSACGHLSNLKNKKWLEILQKKDLTTKEINEFVEEYLESIRNGTFNKDDFVDEGKHAEHRVSKMAMTALTMVQQRKYQDKNISINAVHPGHVKTDMANGKGDLEADTAAQTILYLILDASPNLKGVFMWHDKKIVDWYDYEGDYFCKDIW